MPAPQGGFLIRFDEEQRATFLRDVDRLEAGFSDALSTADWAIKQWEVAGLLFEPGVITHWSLARRTKRVVTAKARVAFTEITPTRISLPALERLVESRFRNRIVSARSGVGGRIPPATWAALKVAVGAIDTASRAALERLERLRDQSHEPIDSKGVDVIAQERDAVGLSLDVFDETKELRKRTLRAWVAPDRDRLTSLKRRKDLICQVKRVGLLVVTKLR